MDNYWRRSLHVRPPCWATFWHACSSHFVSFSSSSSLSMSSRGWFSATKMKKTPICRSREIQAVRPAVRPAVQSPVARPSASSPARWYPPAAEDHRRIHKTMDQHRRRRRPKWKCYCPTWWKNWSRPSTTTRDDLLVQLSQAASSMSLRRMNNVRWRCDVIGVSFYLAFKVGRSRICLVW